MAYKASPEKSIAYLNRLLADKEKRHSAKTWKAAYEESRQIASAHKHAELAALALKAGRKFEEANFAEQTAIFLEKLPAPINTSKAERYVRLAAAKACGIVGKMSARANQMYMRDGYTISYIRQVNQSRGNAMFYKMCELGAGKYTAEYIVAKHFSSLISAKVYKECVAMLAEQKIFIEDKKDKK